MFPLSCPVCKHDSLEYDDRSVHCTNCTVYSKKLPLYKRPLAWALTKPGLWWRVVIVVWFVVMLFQNWANPEFALNRLANPFSAVDFGIHELGHFLFIPFGEFGEFMTIAGGSLFQCIFPLLWIAGLLQIRYYFGAVLCLCWLGLNLFDVATYVADANVRLLSLAGPGSLLSDGSEEAYDAGHDWYQLLSRTGHLDADQTIAGFLRVVGSAIYILGLILAVTIIVYIVIGRRRRAAATELEATQKDTAG